jgi:glycosyltransferase involved in cell wall biosynthesis
MTAPAGSAPLRVVHVSHSDLAGGAARAAWRLHRSLVAAGIDSRMIVADRQSHDDRVVRHWPAARTHRVMRRWLGPQARRLATLPGGSFVSLNLLPSGIVRAAEAMEPDVVHLHWLGFETASIEEIGRIRRPAVWTLHDMWPFSGASHYEADEPSSVWRAGAAAPAGWRERSTWRRKSRAWREVPFEFIAPSHWLEQLLANSALFRGRRATVIPNTLDLERFKPCGKVLARERVGLPAERPVIGFGAVGGLWDPRKGGERLLDAVRQLPAALLQRRPLLCIFGQDRPQPLAEMPVEIRWLGRIDDERLLPLVYSALDVMVVPSVMDNLPQIGVEAQACGCPVVTFGVTGMRELVEHQRTGYLAEAGSAASLAEGMAWVLADSGRGAALGAEARRRAESLWAPAVVAGAHRALYERTTSERSARESSR